MFRVVWAPALLRRKPSTFYCRSPPQRLRIVLSCAPCHTLRSLGQSHSRVACDLIKSHCDLRGECARPYLMTSPQLMRARALWLGLLWCPSPWRRWWALGLAGSRGDSGNVTCKMELSPPLEALRVSEVVAILSLLRSSARRLGRQRDSETERQRARQPIHNQTHESA